MKHEISLGRRLLGLTIDWLMCYAIAFGLIGDTRLTLLVFFVETLLLTAFGGATAGHRLIKVKVVSFQRVQTQRRFRRSSAPYCSV
jgi:hypothetical protein